MNLTQEDTGDRSMFLGAATVVLSAATVPANSAPTPIRLVEAKVFAQLDQEEGERNTGL